MSRRIRYVLAAPIGAVLLAGGVRVWTWDTTLYQQSVDQDGNTVPEHHVGLLLPVGLVVLLTVVIPALRTAAARRPPRAHR